MVMMSFGKKLILTIGIFCFPYTTFGMELKTFKDDSDENTLTLKSATPQEQLPLLSPLQNNAAATRKTSSVSKKQNLAETIGNLFKSKDVLLAEKKIVIFDNNINSAFGFMEEYTKAKKPSEDIEILRLNFYLHWMTPNPIDHQGQKKNFHTLTEELIAGLYNHESAESLLDQLWNSYPVSLYLATPNYLGQIESKVLNLISSSALFLFEITKPCPKNEEEIDNKFLFKNKTRKSKDINQDLLDSLCICYPELSKRFPHLNEYRYHSAKYLTLKGRYAEAWPFIVNCTEFQGHMHGAFEEEVKWTKQLRIGYLSEITKENNRNPFSEAECYLEIAKVTKRINKIENNECEKIDWEAASHYFASAERFYLHDPETAYRTIMGWDLNILYPLTHIASEHLEGSAQNKNALLAIRACCFKLLKEAAHNGGGYAQLSLGKIYEEGLGVPVNWDEAFKWYGLASEQGHIEATERLKRAQPLINTQNAGSEAENNDSALAEKDEGSDQWSLVRDMLDDPDTAYLYGLMYFLGQKFPQSFEYAAICFGKAAEHGHLDALFNLGKMFEVGIREDISQDEKKAATYYLLAADLGHVGAQYEVALMYEEGRGVPKDTEKANTWFKKAASNKHVNAQVKIFLLNNVLPDNRKAMDLCLKHAEEAAPRIQYQIGEFYEKQDDYETAAYWYEKAAKQGYVNAQYKLGVVLQRVGGKESLIKAAKCYYEAARQGHSLAQYSLGLIFEGMGNQKFLIKAIKMYILAAKQGHPNAQNKLTELHRKMRSAKKTSDNL